MLDEVTLAQINGEYAMTGMDATTLEAGATYAFRVEKVEG